MREIKFRGRQLYEIYETAKTFASPKGTWHYGTYCYAHKYTKDGENGYLICDIYGRPVMCDKETIGQYTGLKDRNGMEIYEGDVVRWTHDFCCGEFTEKVEHQKVNGVIVWAEQVGKFIMKDTDNNYWDFKRIQTNMCLEFIGTIHDKERMWSKIGGLRS